jgi:uncharacterized membrane protein
MTPKNRKMLIGAGLFLIILGIFMFSFYIMPGVYVSKTFSDYINLWGTTFLVIGIIMIVIGYFFKRT